MEQLKKIPIVKATPNGKKKEHRRLTVRKEVYEAIEKVKKQNGLKSVSQVIEIVFKLAQLNQDLKSVFKMDLIDHTDNRADRLNTPEATANRLKAHKARRKNNESG